MIRCKACGERIGKTRKVCRHCGAKLSKGIGVGRIIGGVIMVLIFLGVAVPFLIGSALGPIGQDKKVLVEEIMNVPADKFYFQSLEVKQPLEVRVIVERQSGPSVDVYCLNDTEFAQLQKLSGTVLIQGDVAPNAFVAALSRESLAGRFESGWVKLQPGRHHIVVDNTYYGPSEPQDGGPGDASVYCNITVRKPR